MKVEHTKRALPNLFSRMPKWGKLVTHEGVIKLTRYSGLRIKVLVFRTNRDLRMFWANALGRPELCRWTHAAVSQLGTERVSFVGTPGERRTMFVDPRYVCVMGFIESHITTNIVAHESGHAAFAWAKRVRRNLWLPRADFDEEDICYPLGKITESVNWLMHEWGLYPTTKGALHG